MSVCGGVCIRVVMCVQGCVLGGRVACVCVVCLGWCVCVCSVCGVVCMCGVGCVGGGAWGGVCVCRVIYACGVVLVWVRVCV